MSAETRIADQLLDTLRAMRKEAAEKRVAFAAGVQASQRSITERTTQLTREQNRVLELDEDLAEIDTQIAALVARTTP